MPMLVLILQVIAAMGIGLPVKIGYMSGDFCD